MNATAQCGCCAGITAQTPAVIDNRPGLGEIAYRIGTWAQFKSSMLDALSTIPELSALKSRDDDDFTVALCDAFSVVCDILTFYYERSANEHYLRTATQLASVAELSALIGYEPSPGVAASTSLAFTLQAPPPVAPNATSAPQPLLVPSRIALSAGVQVQSVPDPNQQPVTFETATPITARYAWNALVPIATAPYADNQKNRFPTWLRLEGLIGTLQPGDHVLVVVDGNPALNRVTSVTQDSSTKTTFVTFEFVPWKTKFPVLAPLPSTFGSILTGALNAWTIGSQVAGVTWLDQADFVAQAQKLGWDIEAAENLIDAVKSAPPLQPPLQVFKLGVRASIFGHNAPSWNTLISYPALGGPIDDWEGTTLWTLNPTAPPAYVPLDTTYPAIVNGTWVVLKDDTTGGFQIAQVSATRNLSLARYMISATVTELRFDNLGPAEIGFLLMRTTQVLAATEAYTPAQEWLSEIPIAGSLILLATAELELTVGQQVVVTGQSVTKTNQTASELRTIQALALVDGRTLITLDRALDDWYVRDSVTINANVAPATEGTSTSQILGSGDASQAYQTFALNQLPITYVSAATPSTTASTLAISVNGELWNEVPYLHGYAPTAKVYVTKVDENGNRFVMFGDGVENGARLPSGTNNVIARYRQGLGRLGNVKAKQLSMLLTRPLGLSSAINPLAATGGNDPQTIADARAVAPITVRALDRIVSLDDYGDFAAASAVVAKASAVWAWNGVRQVVCITVSGPNGVAIVPETNAYNNLLAAILSASDGTVPATLCPFVQRTFTLGATLTVDPSLDADLVVANAKAALQATFNFDARSFMQPVFRSEVIATLQAVAGVVALTLDTLQYNDNIVEPSLLGLDGLTAAPPTLVAGKLVGAELLTIDAGPLPKVVHA